MATPAFVHLWRMLVWGRRLGRHGALRPFEDRRLPWQVRVTARAARFGTGAPATPDFAAGLRAVGPAAIKLGQALATRPDLIGMEAAMDLARLQDSVPPVPFARMEDALNAGLGAPWQRRFESIDPEAVGRGVDRAGPQGRHVGRADGGDQDAAPRHRGRSGQSAEHL